MTPDLSYYWVGAQGEWREDNKWDEKKKCCRGILLLSIPHTASPSFSVFFFLCVSILLSRQILRSNIYRLLISGAAVVHPERRC